MKNDAGLFLAFDQSTSATKAMLFLTDGSLIDQEALPHAQLYPQAGWVEHDAGEIFNNTIQVASTLLNRHPGQNANLLALSITNQRETFVLFDRESGQPLHNAIVWQCRRGAGFCSQLVEAGNESSVHELTGLKIDTYFPASKLHWLLDARPELRERLSDGSALFGTMDTYLIYRLTCGQVYATDHTNASRTLFYDIGKLSWSKELCNLFGVEFAQLPEIRESSEWFGDTNILELLDRRIPINGVMGDSQAALFAQRCYSPGSAKVTFGTGSSVLLNIGCEKRISKKGMLTALSWVLDGQPSYAYEGIINFTGATIAWLRDQANIIDDPMETEILAKSISDTNGVFFVPAFVGLSAPYWRADVRAAILGMTPSTTRAHIVRAALESIGYMITDVLRSMGTDEGIHLDTIYADGGAVRNTFLMQFVADMNQLKLRAAQAPELSALGAVYSGFLGLKIYNSLKELEALPYRYDEYLPLLDTEQVKKLLAGWQSAVQQVLYLPK
jgi:glycerol kinase